MNSYKCTNILCECYRVDIVLLMPWNESAKRRELVPRISELGWINDASASFWVVLLRREHAAIALCSLQSEWAVPPLLPRAWLGESSLTAQQRIAASLCHDVAETHCSAMSLSAQWLA